MQAAEYVQIQEALTQAHSLTDAAEAHGTLTGCLCATGGYRFEDWLAEILPAGAAPPHVADPLRVLFSDTAGALDEALMEFSPLLPDDEEPLQTRAEALGAWARGFLYGLGTSSLTDAALLPGEVGEVVRDMTEITRVAADSAHGESDEDAYIELVEFIRAGVQLLFDELAPLRAGPPPPEGSLH